MNGTNRALNRLILIVVGLILVAFGGGILLVYAWPAAAGSWHAASAAGEGRLRAAIHATMIGDTRISWVTAGILVAIVLLIALLIVTFARLGGGRTRSLIRTQDRDSDRGRITIDSAFASDALVERLDQRDDLLASQISVATVRNAPMMHVRITPRQNTSPRDVADDVDRLLGNLAVLTDTDIPTYLSIHAGLRARLARDQRAIA
jgi:hypothetical protein